MERQIVKIKKWFIDLVWVTTGVALVALGLVMFLVPNKIAAGGVSGAAIVVYHVLGFPVGITMLFMNIPLFALGVYRLGLSFGFMSLYGTLGLSLLVDLFHRYVPVPTHDPFLASLYGGAVIGLGLGLVFRARGSTGGTALAAALLRSYTGLNIGRSLFLVDALVVLAAGLAFQSWELALYALLSIFVTGWVTDMVQEGMGMGYAKAFFIISNKPDDIGVAILEKLDRGGTALRGKGLYTGTDKDVLLTVVGRSEVSRLKELVYDIDPSAFVILTDVKEVLGEGFKKYGKDNL